MKKKQPVFHCYSIKSAFSWLQSRTINGYRKDFICMSASILDLKRTMKINIWKHAIRRVTLLFCDIKKDNFTKHPHLYKQPLSRSVKSLKKKMEKLHRKYVFAPVDKATNSVIVIWKKKTIRGRGFEGWIKYYEYICTCSVDERPTSCASYHYSNENRCQNW